MNKLKKIILTTSLLVLFPWNFPFLQNDVKINLDYSTNLNLDYSYSKNG